jgi:hypothetical protein
MRAIHYDLLSCLEDYKAYTARTPSISPSESVLASGSGTSETILGCLCVYKYMLAALCEAEELHLEAECQALVVLSLEAHKQPVVKHSWLHTELGHSVAPILQHTRPSWEKDSTGRSTLDQRMASRKGWQTFRGYTILLRL